VAKFKTETWTLIPPYILTPAGETLGYVPADGKEYTLKEAQSAVGGWVECVRLSDELIMLVDEEGRLFSKLPNEEASRVAGRPIVGNALVCPVSMFP
jgi:hypothetical protein